MNFALAIDPAAGQPFPVLLIRQKKKQMQGKSTSSLRHLTGTTIATTPNTRFFHNNYKISNPNN